MIEVLVDQKVFIKILQETKPELFKHFANLELDVALVLFQWFLWIFSSQFNQEVTETIWDLLFLEGTVTIFRAALAILDAIEEEVLSKTEFIEIYPIINNKPFQIINTSQIIISHMKKFMNLSEERIIKLRNEFRPEIYLEQKKVWSQNLKLKENFMNESIMAQRVKFLGKFPLLDNYVRNVCCEEIDKMENIDIDINSCKFIGL